MRSLFPLLALTATACASGHDGNYPSLAPRAIEQRSDAEPEVVPVVAAPDPALDAKLKELAGSLAQATASFEAAAARIAARVPAAKAGGIGSDAWVDTQTALSELQPPRDVVAGVVADLEQLAIDRAAAGQPPYPALEAAKQAAAAAAETQRSRYEELAAALPSP